MPDQEDYYGGMSDSMQGESSDDAPEKEGDMEESETALLPKSFFEGKSLKPGDQFYVEVVREHEGEIEVKYPHDVKESSMKGSMDSMDEMASETSDGGY